VTAPQDPRTAAGWPVPEEAVRAAERRIRDCVNVERDPDIDVVLLAAAPYIVAATLRQAAERLLRTPGLYVGLLSQPGVVAGAGHAADLLTRWAGEVQP
jgi:hypothetical protein